MSTVQNMEEKLWLYIDGQLPAQEKMLIDRLVESDIQWKSKYKELLEVNELLRSSELEAPSMRFTKNVMEEIARIHIAPATRTYINKKVIWGIGFFFIAMLIGVLVFGFAQLGTTSGEPGQIGKTMGSVDVSSLFSNTWVNVLLGMNVILGLFFLDVYLSNKKKEMKRERPY